MLGMTREFAIELHWNKFVFIAESLDKIFHANPFGSTVTVNCFLAVSKLGLYFSFRAPTFYWKLFPLIASVTQNKSKMQ